MADNIDVTPGTGKTVAADEISTVLYQRIKVVIGADGVNNGDVSSANPLPISAAGFTDGTQKTKVIDSSGATIASYDDGNGGKAFGIGMAATSFVFSSANSSTTQLAAGATFAGAIESVTNQQSASILLTTDQNGTLVFTEYIDAAGTKVSRSTTASIVAGAPYSKSFALNGNYFKAAFTNNGAVATTTFNLNTAYGTIPSASAMGNMPMTLDEVNGTQFTLGRKSAALSLPVALSTPSATYSASVNALTIALLATDIFTITGSATKTVKIRSIHISGVQTSASYQDILILKRSTANTAGTSVTQTNIPYDSTDAAATAVVRSYTANPTLGTLVGRMANKKFYMPIAIPGNNGQFGPDNYVEFNYGGNFDKEVVLRGTSEVLAVNFNGVTAAGSNMNINIIWTEE